MDNRRYKIHKEGRPLKQVRSFNSMRTPVGRSTETQRLNPKQMREEMTAGLILAQKRKAGEFKLGLLPPFLRLTYLCCEGEEARLEKEKLRKLNDFDNTFSGNGLLTDIQADSVLSGKVVLPASHAGEEFLQILLDDENSEVEEGRP